MRTARPLAFLAAAFGAAPGSAAPPQAAGRLLREVLPNGATVLVQEVRGGGAVAVIALLRGGVAAEDPTRPGAARLMVHSMIRGSERYPGGGAAAALVRVGGELQAGAEADACWISATARAAHARIALDVVGDALRRPAFAEAEVAAARGLLSAEAARRAADPSERAAGDLRALAFADHPYARPLAGSPEGLRATDRASLVSAAARATAGGAVVLVVSGDIPAAEALAAAKAAVGPLAAAPAPAPPPLPRGFPGARAKALVGPAPALRFGLLVPGRRHPDAPACEILARLWNARVYSYGVARDRLASSAWAGYEPHADLGLLSAAAVPPLPPVPGGLTRLEILLTEALGEVRRCEIKPEEFERVRLRLEREDLHGSESALGRAYRLARAELCGGLRHAVTWRQRVRQTTLAEVRKAAERYLQLPNLAVVRVVPPGEGEPDPDLRIRLVNARGRLGEEATPAGLDLGRATFSPTAAGEAPPVPAGEGPTESATPAPATLANGLRVVVRTDRSLPVVACGLFFPGGTEAEPPQASGTAALVLRTLFRGSRELSRAAIEAAVERFGAPLEVRVLPDYASAIAAAPAEELEGLLGLLASCVTDPVLYDAEWETARAGLLAEAREAPPREAACHLARARVYGGHACGLPANGTPGGLATSTRFGDGVPFLWRALRPDRSVLAVVGDVSPAEALAAAARAFGSWRAPPGLPEARPPAPGAALPGEVAGVSDRPEGAVALALPWPRFGSPEYAAGSLLASALAWRLRRDLVEGAGTAAEASVEREGLPDGGAMFVLLRAGPGRLAEVRAAAERHLARLREAGLPLPEIEETRSWMAGASVLGLELRAARVAALGRSVMRAGRPDADEAYFYRLERVTPESAAALAKTLLDPSRLVVATVAPRGTK
ncbi:MAG: insulinase family protein [Planctomycetales bacterium]|nr:insulinase family protein [Planctomycetales bacterium]